MAHSASPGILAFTGLDLASPARTPGCLGLNDQGDPRLCTRLGDTPGSTGARDGADASLPWWVPGAPPASGPVRAADGTALALPILAPPLPPSDRPPWMKIAEDEARAYKGQTEETIQRTHTYALRVHSGQATMVGNDHPWCAAFVNWCLQEAGVDIENPTFADHVASKGRAHGFLEVKGPLVGHGDRGVPVVRNPRFELLDQPVFGAIAMVTSSSGQGHHVGFAYSRPSSNFVVLLGGNQDNRISFAKHNVATGRGMTHHLMFFYPAGERWAPMSRTPLGDQSVDALNRAFDIDMSDVHRPGGTR